MSVSPALALLNSYDPTNPSSIDGSLTSSGLSDNYYAQGVNGTQAYDPGAQAPTTVPLSNSAPTPAASSGLNQYMQALDSLTTWSAQTLIQSALGIGDSSANNSAADLTSALNAAAQAQQAQWASQKQAALSAANAALAAGTAINASA